MAPNSHYCCLGRQSMMSVPSLVLIPADNPTDVQVLISGKVNKLPDCAKRSVVPEINITPPSPRLRKRWGSTSNLNEILDDNEVHDWSMEGSETVQTKGSSKTQTNTHVDNKTVAPFIIRRSPRKQVDVPHSKTEDIAPTKDSVISIKGKLNFNQVSVSDDSYIDTPNSPISDVCVDSIITSTSPKVKQVFFPTMISPLVPENKEQANEGFDDVFDDVSLSSSLSESGAKIKAGHNAVNGSKVDTNNSSDKEDDTVYSITGEDWPTAVCTPQQEQEKFKIFCDNEFRENGGITPVIGVIPANPFSEGPNNNLPGDTFHNPLTGETVFNSPTEHPSTNTGRAVLKPKYDIQECSSNSVSEKDKFEITKTVISQKSAQGNKHKNLVNEKRNSSSYFTPPTQTWLPLVLKKNDPTPSPSQLCMEVHPDTAAPLWATPSVLNDPQVVVCTNSDLESCPDYCLEHPYPNKDIGAIDDAISLWSTPTILNVDASQQIVIRTPAVQGGVYSSVLQGSHYSNHVRRRSVPKVENDDNYENETPGKKAASLSYVQVITNIFKGIFGGFNKVNIPVIYPHYDVAKGASPAYTDKKND